jgi:hypothetical protein
MKRLLVKKVYIAFTTNKYIVAQIELIPFVDRVENKLDLPKPLKAFLSSWF